MKTCSRCKESKPLDAYNSRKASRDGKMPSCKLCTAARRKRSRIEGTHLEPELTTDQKKHVYTEVIVRMRQMGLTSARATDEMLERVGEL